ncbi:MAG: MoxR family ATPase [Acidobacteriota bacterium]
MALDQLIANIERVIRGKRRAIETLVTAVVARGHVLLEDLPGLGKTMLGRSLARSVTADFKRVQCTPDLLPTDVTGVSVFQPGTQVFEFRPGPVFTNVLLVDEINRATPRTQSALLEAMEERQVTADGVTRRLEEPFALIATQNPIELAGTFPLPEAQLDRFLVKLSLGYPDEDAELEILTGQVSTHPIDALQPVLTKDQICEAQARARQVTVAAPVAAYIQRLVAATREHDEVQVGASPRGALALMHGSQALAVVKGEGFVTPDHVKRLAPDVLSHRLMLQPRARAAGLTARQVVRQVLDRTPVPVEFRAR